MTFPITFVVPIHPIPKQSYRHGRGRGYQKKRITDAEMLTGLEARKAMNGEHPTECCLIVTAVFYRGERRRADLDNLSKLLCDSMNGIVYRDDSQIMELRLRKVYDPKKPRTLVTVDIMA